MHSLENWLEKKRKEKRIKEMEKETPFIMKSFATLLNAGMSFEKAMEEISKKEYVSSKEFEKTLNEIRLGESVENALYKFKERNKSKQIAKMTNLLTSAYANGENIEMIKKSAEEQREIIKNKMKEYNEKAVLYSLAIIGVSAILPAFTQGFLIIGSAFMDLGISDMQAIFLITVVFPLLNAVIFWISASKKP